MPSATTLAWKPCVSRSSCRRHLVALILESVIFEAREQARSVRSVVGKISRQFSNPPQAVKVAQCRLHPIPGSLPESFLAGTFRSIELPKRLRSKRDGDRPPEARGQRVVLEQHV